MLRRLHALVLVLPLLAGSAACAARSAVVTVPVTDVWSRPLAPNEKPTDDLRETQILKDETVLIHESSGPWVRIEAVEQPEFSHHARWEGYPGWILADAVDTSKKAALPTGSYPSSRILAYANEAIGSPYLWGGMTKAGYDCSGLVHLAYRHDMKVIPRDSHEQWMKATPIKRAELKANDLIFSAKAENPKKITHVTIYAGDGMIVEAPQTGMIVRKVSFKEKYGKALDEVESGDPVGDRVIYFGSFLHQ